MSIKESGKKVIRTVKNNSPIILLASGAVLFGVSTLFAWRAGHKHDETIAEVKNDISVIKDMAPSEESETYKEDHKNYILNLAKAYVKAGIKLGKIYAPAIASETLAYICTFKAFGIENNRARTAIAACIATEKAYGEYRKRVIDSLGEGADREFRLGIKEVVTDIPDLDKEGKPKLDKDGNPKVKRKMDYAEVAMPEHASMYAVVWDKYSSADYETLKYIDELGFPVDTGRGDTDYNYTRLHQMQQEFTKELQAKPNEGIFLWDVKKALHFNPKYMYPEDRAVGWFNNPNKTGGDIFVDFGIDSHDWDSPYEKKRKDDFKNGITDKIILDFNVCGNIMPYVFPELAEKDERR